MKRTTLTLILATLLILPVGFTTPEDIAKKGYVNIDSEIWTTKNLDVSMFRNNHTIPEIESQEEWHQADLPRPKTSGEIGGCIRTSDEKVMDTKFNMYGNAEDRVKRVETLKSTTLLVVIDSETSAMGKEYKKAFDTYWKFTPYKFIKSSEVIGYAAKPGYSLFMFISQEYRLNRSGQAEANSGNGLGRGGMPTGPGNGRGAAVKWSSYHYMPYYVPQNKNYLDFRFAIMLSDIKGVSYYNEDELINKLKAVDYCWEYTGHGPPRLDFSLTIANWAMSGEELEKPINDSTLNTSIWNEEQGAINNLVEYVKDLESDVEYIHEYHEEKIPELHTRKCNIAYDKTTTKYVTNYYSYGDAEKAIKTKKLLLWDGLADEFSKKLICYVLDIKESQAVLASKSTIDSIMLSKNNDYAIWTDSVMHPHDTTYNIILGGGKQIFGLSINLETPMRIMHYDQDILSPYNKNDFKADDRAKYQIK